ARGVLPPIACVSAVRDARIARGRGDAPGAAAARQTLEAAVDLPGCELPALSGLLHLLREGAAGAPQAQLIQARLAGRLADPKTELPQGLLTQLAHLGANESGTEGGTEGDQLLLAALESRVAAAVPPGPALATTELAEILEVTVDLQQRLGRDKAARETLDRLLALAPTYGLRWRALLYDLDNNRWQSAADLLGPMVVDPEATDAARFYYVTALAHLGRYDDMLVELDKLAPPPPATVPASAPAGARPAADVVGTPLVLAGDSGVNVAGFASLLSSSAWALRDAGRDAEAAALFRRVLAYAPDDKEAQQVLLHLYGTHEERAAAAAADAARRQEETDPMALFEEGSDLLGAGNAAGARELLARAAPELGDSHYAEPAWYNLGTAAFKLERWEEAAQAFAQAIAVNADRRESHWKRAIALHHLERWRDSVAELERTLVLQPDKRDAHFYLASCFQQLGDAARAARETALFNQPR
ncbi:MAG: tetratricopeptide repeat protein, partial [Thermoanaerobaculia bacterium]